MAAYYFISWIHHKLFNQSHIVKHWRLLILSEIDIMNHMYPWQSIIINSWSVLFLLYLHPFPTLPLKDKNFLKTHNCMTIVIPQKLNNSFISSNTQAVLKNPWYPSFPLLFSFLPLPRPSPFPKSFKSKSK